MPRRRLPEPFTFFVDECLGRNVVRAALQAALLDGESIETRPQGTLDEAWLPDAGERWIVLTIVSYEAGEKLASPTRLRPKAHER